MNEIKLLSSLIPSHPDILPILQNIREKYNIPKISPEDDGITKVTLKIKKQGLVGTDPFTTHSNILVDVRKGAFGDNINLQVLDFQAAASKNAAGTIKNTPSSGWYSVTFNSSAFPYINLTDVTQFRLRFAIDDNNDHGADYLKFNSGNAWTAPDWPLLIIQYYVMP